MIKRIKKKNNRSWRTFTICFLSTMFFGVSYLTSEDTGNPAAWWKLDEVANKAVLDSATKISDPISGNFRIVQGVAGKAIKFDGYATEVIRRASEAPQLSEAFTVEARIAIAAYPWNWCAVLTQQKNKQAGYAFEIGPLGEFALKVFAGGQWRECISTLKIPLKTWAHIASTFDKNKGIVIYLDGKVAGELSFAAPMESAQDVDLLIGMNHTKQKPVFIHREFGTLPAWYSLDAILDEVKIYNVALSSQKVEQAYLALKPSTPPDIPARILSSGPPGSGRFGAYYTKLKYYWEWDDQFRVSDHPDVVVQFDGSPVRVVFWRGTRYSPAWVTENNLWMADQSVEAWDEIEGCFEHMQDPKCLYSHVRVIENTEARIVVHWRYAQVSAHNHLWKVDEKTGWACWVDEYYYFYPDQTGIRKVMWQRDSLGETRQFQESIPLCHPGQLQGDVINPDYVTVANLKGEKQVFSYIKNPPKETTKWIPENPVIQMHNLKSINKPFIIFEPGSEMGYLRDMNIDNLSRPGSCNHWPEGQVPCDGRTGMTSDRATSFLGFPITDPVIHEAGSRNWVNSLYGMTDKPVEEVIRLARSWSHPPQLKVIAGDVESEGYELSQRAYFLKCKEETKPSALEFELGANEESPVVNACLVIKDWGDTEALISIDGRPQERGKSFRLGRIQKLEGTDLVVWVEKESSKPIRIKISPENI